MHQAAPRIRVTDVSPRDGLQNEAAPIATERKVALVRALCAAGVDEVEVSSFVSPKWIPQLGDAAAVFEALRDLRALSEGRRPVFSALVPNEKGLDAALEVNQRAGFALIDKVSVFTAASETFSQKNTNAAIAQTLERFAPVLTRAKAQGLLVRGYVSCVIACPFEGAIGPAKVAEVSKPLRDMGADEIDLGDTIGAGTPATVGAMLDAVGEHVPAAAITLHLHDTFGQAGACVERALAWGVRSFDSAAGGLGGCPYASTPGRRAPGNIDTQLLVRVARAHGYRCDVDDAAMEAAAALARGMRGPAALQ